MCRAISAFLIVFAFSPFSAGQVTFTKYSVAGPIGIAAGPDGNLWYTEGFVSGDHIGRMTTSGVVTLFPVPGGNAEFAIVTGPDGNLWFVEYRANRIGRITAAGVITEFLIPTSGSYPTGITSGPDGNLWFTVGFGATNVGRITPNGVITEFAVPSGYNAGQITAGPDGNLWFTENVGNRIGRLTPTGVITEWVVPTLNAFPYGIVTGPDGNIWFTEELGNKIGRITPGGVITEFPIPSPSTGPNTITAGPDGNLWFTEFGQYIGRITTTGVVTTYPVAATGAGFITTGPDGNIWFTDYYGNSIFKATLPGGFLVNYASNLSAVDSVVNLTNTGPGTLCANLYVFSPDEQLIACCSCAITPNGLASLSARNDLISSTLTPAMPSSIVVKMLPSTASTCNPASVGTLLSGGLAGWQTGAHAGPGGGFAITETPFVGATFSQAELARITGLCGFIQSNGSGYGICKSCRSGALGGANR